MTLYEVMGNILDNAYKYCLKYIEVSACRKKIALHIMIEDDGPCIPASKRTLIFQRKQRADTFCPGQGLGLSLATEIIEQYESDFLNKGTCHLAQLFFYHCYYDPT
ncbi:ATP-binding protein [secondary endosymbiont of Ctenarytaina eucalypti]|uniref:histidine kinase n=1 Tax=secondary endosymbiont of Ctenarytaina eucalypti TaxID=1199245 RepID=J3Z2U3_9ENTR|nr:ATP-binding protein [secondary endosymbiont of Ctenarytaina eucalypti]AFP84524.1 histidine kinase [secondary endosymbiont of Ctenarytaina eucalypti]